MDDLSFLEQSDRGNLLVEVRGPDPKSPEVALDDVSSDLVLRAAPALFNRIIAAPDGIHRLFFKESAAVVISLFRFIYLDDYLATENLMGNPCSFLLHCQLYKLGLTFEMPKLVAIALANANREVELACSNPPMVLDLVDAIHFLYLELPDAEDLFNIVANYCVGCFLYHKLDQSEEFRQTLFGAPEFLKLLLKTSMDRGFDAEGAQDLIKANACEHRLHRSLDPNIRAAARFTCHLHGEALMEAYKPPRDIWRQPTEYTLVHRSRFPTGMPTSEDVAVELQNEEYESQPHIPSHWADAPETVIDGPKRVPKPSAAPQDDDHDRSSATPTPNRPESPQLPGTLDEDYLWTYQDPVPPEWRRLAVTNYSEADMQSFDDAQRAHDAQRAAAIHERELRRMADRASNRRYFNRASNTTFSEELLLPVPVSPPPTAAVDAPSSPPEGDWTAVPAASDPRGKGKGRAPDASGDESDADWTLV